MPARDIAQSSAQQANVPDLAHQKLRSSGPSLSRPGQAAFIP
jgi:hypothetical protein